MTKKARPEEHALQTSLSRKYHDLSRVQSARAAAVDEAIDALIFREH
jgi:hypothetical protein